MSNDEDLALCIAFYLYDGSDFILEPFDISRMPKFMGCDSPVLDMVEVVDLVGYNLLGLESYMRPQAAA